tara:strand:+ start:208 stop:630 length:423 start_codon:yes stop_codon:yes gene_type:complete
MTKELENEEFAENSESAKMHNITSKAGRLAMELSLEKKRLAQELEELQGEYDDIKPLTPTGTRDWYVKWSSMILGVVGVFLISAEIYLFGQMAYLISAIGWIYVGMQWGDRAIMIGSAISGTAVAMFLIEKPELYLRYFS